MQSKSEAKTSSKATAAQVAALKQQLALRDDEGTGIFLKKNLSLSIILLKICCQFKWMVDAQHSFPQFFSSA